MASTIRKVITDIQSKLEALTPVTGGTVKYAVIDAILAGGDSADIPETIAHRAIVLDFDESESLMDIVGAEHAWLFHITVNLWHVWKRSKALEAKIIQVEDVQQIKECFEFQRPGTSTGVKLWTPGDESLTRYGDRWQTTISFTGRMNLDTVVDPT